MSLSSPITGEERTQGQYRVSIGTSLAFETLFGINENIKPTNPLPFTRYTVIYINLRTLIRNIHGAVLKELRQEYGAGEYVKLLLEEMEQIPFILGNQSNDRLSVIFYINTLDSIRKRYPNAILREPKVVGGSKYDMIETTVIHKVLARAKELNVMVVDTAVPIADEDKVLFMTHLPVDLLPYTQSKRVDLIESHTGVIKDSYKWYTKLSGKDMERIPFTKMMIQVFGDGKTFKGIAPKERKMVLEFAIANNWNQTTTDRLIDAQLSRFPDRDLANRLRKLR